MRPVSNSPRGDVVAGALYDLALGRFDCLGTVTLAAGATSTNKSVAGVQAGDLVFLFPQSANAAAAVTTTYVNPASTIKGRFTVTHSNTATTDRSFSYLFVRGPQ
jgi:hypothetical protein